MFFQAEDGIRYLVRSRGLGDVYKRQDIEVGRAAGQRGHGRDDAILAIHFVAKGHSSHGAVSYTHLTLPTSDLV